MFPVRTTPRGHAAIRELLARLRAATAPVRIEVRHFALKAAELDEDARARIAAAAGGASWDEASVPLAELVAHDICGGRRGGVVESPAGRWSVYRSVRQRRYLPEYDVEIAQAASIADPVPFTATEGVQVALRPLPMLDGRFCVRVVASTADLDPELETFSMRTTGLSDEVRIRETDFGTVEQATSRGSAVATEYVTGIGGNSTTRMLLLAGPERGPRALWHVLLLRVEGAAAPPPADGLSVFPAGAWATGDASRLIAVTGRGAIGFCEQEAEAEPRFAIDAVLGDFEAVLDSENLRAAWLYPLACREGQFVVSYGPPDSQARLREKLRGMDSLIAPYHLEVRLESRGAGSNLLGALAFPLTAGRLASAAAYLRRDYVGDYDVEVAQEARIADPILHVSTVGAFANVTLTEIGGNAVHARLDLLVSAAPDGVRQIRGDTGGVPPLQSVPTRESRASVSLDLEPGVPATLELGEDPSDPTGGSRMFAVVKLAARNVRVPKTD